MEAICSGEIGFDVRRAHKHGIAQAVKDKLGVGGHVYGHGAYFAEAALYSHWWFGRKHPHVKADGTVVYTLILAQVLTGRSKDFGPSWAPDLSLEPDGFHSVCGTEADQKVAIVVSSTTSIHIVCVSGWCPAVSDYSKFILQSLYFFHILEPDVYCSVRS